jgi:2-iminobutanoate/2-iminopropanoate deaminase
MYCLAMHGPDAAPRQIVDAPAAPAAIGPYSHAVRAGGLLFCSGQIPLDPATGELVGASAGEQAERCLRNLDAVCTAAGSALRHAVRLTIYMTDLSEFAAVNDVYGTFFDDAPPARVTVGVGALPRGALVEIDAVVALEVEPAKPVSDAAPAQTSNRVADVADRATTRAGAGQDVAGAGTDSAWTDAGESVFHVELRQFPHNMARFNLSAAELRATVLEPWVRERPFEFGERRWSPHQAKLTVLAGPPVPFDQLTMGRGWRAAQRDGRETTAALLSAVERELGG